MKAIELAQELLKNPEFEVDLIIFEEDNSDWGFSLKKFVVAGIEDIGYSDQIIRLRVNKGQ